MAKSKRLSPPMLIVGIIFLITALTVLAAALVAVQASQTVFSKASSTPTNGTYYYPSEEQKKSGCIARPTCLDEMPACRFSLPKGARFCDKVLVLPSGSPISRPGSGLPSGRPVPSQRPIYK